MGDIETLLKKYFSGALQTEIKNRRLQAQFPPSQGEANPTKVQVSTTGESPQESLYERLESDRQLRVLERKKAILDDYMLYIRDIEDGIGYDILRQHYYQKKTWQEVSQNLGYSLKPIRDRRNTMLKELKERMATLE